MSGYVKKRWAQNQMGESPFALTSAVSTGLRNAAKEIQSGQQAPIRYLWVHFSTKDRENEQPRLNRDEWLGVIDEAASMGARVAIFSIADPLTESQDVLAMSEWAQTTHDMTVGIHIYNRDVTRHDARCLSRLNAKLTRLFVGSEGLAAAEFVKQMGIQVVNADGIDDGIEAPSCELPQTMTCVGPEGSLYTCGLVMGNQQFHLGNFLERKLKNVICDQSVPHQVPKGASHAKNRCSGCPPLMARRIHEDR